MQVGDLHVGEPVRLLDGATATVEAVRVVAGAADMWDLTIADVHTFAVGDAQAVVHYCGYNSQRGRFRLDGEYPLPLLDPLDQHVGVERLGLELDVQRLQLGSERR